MNFEINLTFLIKPFFLHDQKVMIKLKYFEKEKSILHHFSSTFNEANNTNFLEGESPTLSGSSSSKVTTLSKFVFVGLVEVETKCL